MHKLSKCYGYPSKSISFLYDALQETFSANTIIDYRIFRNVFCDFGRVPSKNIRKLTLVRLDKFQLVVLKTRFLGMCGKQLYFLLTISIS